jgi:hypothetical protein
MIKIIPDGMPKFSAKEAKKNLDALLKELSNRVRQRVISSTPRDSGMAARSWTQPRFEKIDESFPVGRQSRGISFGNTAPYAHILETGSQPGKRPWPSVGPRTVEQAGRIYSSQAPGGIFLNAQLEKVVERELPKIMEKLLSPEKVQ